MFAALVDDTAMSEHAVKHGNEEQGQDGGECQTAYHGCTHGAPHFGALSGADGHRYHTENGGEGCHDYRTQT